MSTRKAPPRSTIEQAVEREQTRIEKWLRQQGGSGPFFSDALAECRREALDAARQTATDVKTIRGGVAGDGSPVAGVTGGASAPSLGHFKCIPGSCSTHEGMPFFVDTRDSSAFCIFCEYAQQADEIARLNLRLAALMGER